jgi:hypothetical protein
LIFAEVPIVIVFIDRSRSQRHLHHVRDRRDRLGAVA